MKLAIVGSRLLEINDLENYIPENVTEIVSGGAKGIDTCAKSYAMSHGITYKEFLPEYSKYGKAAPIVRNREIAEYVDAALAFWDGKSKGTKNVISLFRKLDKDITIIEKNKSDTLS